MFLSIRLYINLSGLVISLSVPWCTRSHHISTTHLLYKPLFIRPYIHNSHIYNNPILKHSFCTPFFTTHIYTITQIYNPFSTTIYLHNPFCTNSFLQPQAYNYPTIYNLLLYNSFSSTPVLQTSSLQLLK